MDCMITLGSLLVGVYYVIVEPLVRRWRRERAARQLPPPRYPPQGSDDSLLSKLLAESNGVSPIGIGDTGSTSGHQVAPVPGTCTSSDSDRREQITALVRAGYSANQVCRIVGGRRAEVLAEVRRLREGVGYES